MRLFKKLLGVIYIIFLCGVIFSCQSQNIASDPEPMLQVSEKTREDNAKELLQKKYKSISFAEFKGDKDFSSYLKLYLERANPALGSEAFMKTVFNESILYDYDPVFLVAVIKTESQFNANAIGLAGEIGLMQIKPSTAQWICKKKGVKWKGAKALKDPSYNVKVSAMYFKYLRKKLNANSSKYLNAYNLGITKLQRLPASEISSHPYYYKVINNYSEIYQELKKIKTQLKYKVIIGQTAG